MALDVQREIDKAVQNFTQDLLKLFREAMIQAVNASGTPRAAAPAAPAAPATRTRTRAPARTAAPATRRSSSASSRGPKSSPEEVRQLGERIVDALKKAGRNLSASELQDSVDAEHGPFHYALSKLKESGRVKQIGERRMARYSLGGRRTAAKSSQGRKNTRKNARKAAPASGGDEGSSEETNSEAGESDVVDAEFEQNT